MAHKEEMKKAKPATQILGIGYDPNLSEGAAVPPVFRTSTFIFKSAEEGKRAFELAYGLDVPKEKEIPALIYSRVNNPNTEMVEDRLNVWDRTEASALFSSGMGAISSMCMAFLKPGDSILFSDPVYGGTEFFFRHMLPSLNIDIRYFPSGASQEDVLEIAKSMPTLKMIFIETPSNPTMQLTSIRACKNVADQIQAERGTEILLAVDNTFCGPIFLSPIDHGADLIVYSVTKFIGGHSDLVAGAVLGKKKHIDAVKVCRTIFGASTDPDTAWLILRSLPTLQLRMEHQCKSAQRLVEMMKSHPKVVQVNYPGMDINNASQTQIFRDEYKGSGSIISFRIKGGEKEAFKVLNNLKIMNLAVSLGGVETLIEHPATMTHSDMSQDELQRANITHDLIRISIGLEDATDLIDDLDQALNLID